MLFPSWRPGKFLDLPMTFDPLVQLHLHLMETSSRPAMETRRLKIVGKFAGELVRAWFQQSNSTFSWVHSGTDLMTFMSLCLCSQLSTLSSLQKVPSSQTCCKLKLGSMMFLRSGQQLFLFASLFASKDPYSLLYAFIVQHASHHYKPLVISLVGSRLQQVWFHLRSNSSFASASCDFGKRPISWKRHSMVSDVKFSNWNSSYTNGLPSSNRMLHEWCYTIVNMK